MVLVGVGSYVCEALVRAGIGHLTLIDGDIVSDTNINRQLIADTTTIGKPKVEIAKNRYLSINSDIDVKTYYEFYSKEKDYFISNVSYVADCIDSVKDKLDLIETCINKNIPIISSMGTGNKLDASLFEISDISKTSVCPLAKVIRKELKKRNIYNLPVIYSKELPVCRTKTPSSISFVPACARLTFSK